MNSTRRILYIGLCEILTLTLIPSCMVVRKEYHRPQFAENTLDSLYRKQNQGSDTTSIAALPWRMLFKDAQLQLLIEKGMENNNDLKVAEARIKSAKAAFSQSKKALLPSLTYILSASREKISDSENGSSTITNSFSALGEASWEADIWGKLSSTKKADYYLLKKSEGYKKEVQTEVVASIAEYYYTLMAYDKQLDITNRTIINREQDVKMTKALFEFSTGTSSDVSQSIANLHSAKLTKVSLEQSIEEAENALCTVLGIPAKKIHRNNFSNDLEIPSIQIGLPIQLLANRPDVEEAENNLRYYTEMVNVARAYFYPSLSISGDIGWESSKLKKLIDPASFVWSLLGSLTQPIFQQGENKQRLEEAKANVDEYTATFKQTLLDAAQEVNDNMIQYKKGKELESERMIQIQNLEKAVDDTKFIMGKSSSVNYVDVLTAEKSLLNAELSAIDDKLQQTNAIIGVYRSLGGGWK
ncbi:MAG: hypothetical protein H6Q14_76 [Bacteroidetes bacterium]|nr:hypothetical protein [Bacteroidota bacterium]